MNFHFPGSVYLKKFHGLIIIFVLFISSKGSYAQSPPPYAYDTPLGTIVHTWQQSEFNNEVLSFSDINPLAGRFDGLMIRFSATMDLTRLNNLLSFSTDNFSSMVVEVFYQSNTLKLRRYLDENVYYDYVLLDPLFETNQSPEEGTWEVRFYFTSSFFWIQTEISGVTNQHYLSPVYWGMDFIGSTNMTHFLNRATNAKLKMGALGNANSFSIAKQVEMYAFNYSALQSDIQQNFSNNLNSSVASRAITHESSSLKDNFQQIGEVKIYPNPSQDGIYKITSNTLNAIKGPIAIYDLSGQLIYEKEVDVEQEKNSIILDLSHLTKSIYVFKVQMGDNLISRFLITN